MSSNPSLSTNPEYFEASKPPVSVETPDTRIYGLVPQQLKNRPNWVCWKYVVKDGKPTKIPFDAKTGRPAKANDPTTWVTFAEAFDAADPLNGSDYDGVGFELGGTSIVGVDFDNAINDKGIDPYVLEILRVLGNPYTETSPSGKGLHSFVECDALPNGGRKMSQGHNGIEIYHGREGGRYFATTGERVLGEGVPRIADIALAYMLITQNRDKKFRALWLGDTSAYDGDESSADLALMVRLARLTQNDPAKMETFFSKSYLGRREKWTDREDYRRCTIAKALKNKYSNQSAVHELVFSRPAVPVTEEKFGECVLAKLPNQIDDNEGWFPRGAVSLLGAPSGAGKTTTMYQLLLAQKNREPFLGHATYGLPFCVMGVDRGEAAHWRTMRRMHMSIEAIPFEGLSLAWDFDAVQQIAEKIEAHPVIPAVVLIEGVDILVSQVNDIKSVSLFMNLLHQVAKRFHIALIGTLGSPKIKIGQGYVAKRDNLLGSQAWGRECETVVNLQFPQSDDTDGRRLLFVLPRNGAAEHYTLKFNHGQLERIPDIEETEMDSASEEIQWFQAQARLAKTDPTKEWWTVLDMERALKMAHSTACRHIADEYAKHHVVAKRGKKNGKAAQYRWNESQTNPIWVVQQEQDAADLRFGETEAVN